MTMTGDFLLRINSGDTGTTSTRVGALYLCPDIIPAGTSPVPDFKTEYTTPASYAKNYAGNLVYMQPNYLYMRAKLLTSGVAAGRARLYYTPSSLINWPNLWQNNQLAGDSGDKIIAIDSSGTGPVFCADEPFMWSPGSPPSGSHYCLIGIADTAANPVQIPQGSVSSEDYATWIYSHLGVAQKNVSLIDVGQQPDWTTSINYEQPITEMIHFILTTVNVPIGCAVKFECGTPGPIPPINIDKTVIDSPNQVIGQYCSVPAGFKGNINYSFWSNGKKIPTGAKVSLQGVYVPPSSNKFLQSVARPLADFGLPKAYTAQVGPVTAVVLGGYETLMHNGS